MKREPRPSGTIRRIAQHVAVALVALGVAAWTGRARAETCTKQNLSVSFESITFIEPLESFDLCVSAPIRGTLRGTIVSCIKFADIMTSDALWSDGETGMLVARWHDVVETPDGTITMAERGMMDGVTGLQSTMFQVVSGTRRYAGASGLLTGAPEWPNRTSGYEIRGVLCTP